MPHLSTATISKKTKSSGRTPKKPPENFLEEEPVVKKRKGVGAVAKGSRNEKKTHRWLEQHGYTVYTKPRVGHRAKSVDIFGLFDHVAIQKTAFAYVDGGNNFLSWYLLVQTKTNTPPSKKTIFKEYVGFAHQHDICDSAILIFLWKDRDPHPYICVCREDIESPNDLAFKRHPDRLITKDNDAVQ